MTITPKEKSIAQIKSSLKNVEIVLPTYSNLTCYLLVYPWENATFI